MNTPGGPKRRLLLHVGPHKTGTTAIQRALVQNRDVLATYGAVYPEIGFSYFGHHKIAESLAGKYRRAEFLSYMDEIRRVEEPWIILSSENFSRCSSDDLQLLAHQLSDFDVTVVYYLRNFLEFPYSWWQEQVKHRYLDDFMTFMTNTLLYPYKSHLFNASNAVEAFSRAFGKAAVAIYLYNDVMQKADGDVSIQFIASVLGMKGFSEVQAIKSSNKSLGAIDAELVRMLNRGGHRGIEMLGNDGVRELKQALATEGKPFLREVSLSYNSITFVRLEKEMLLRWGDIIRGGDELKHAGELFSEREKIVKYIDPHVWIFNEALGVALHEVIAQLGEPAQ